MYSEDMSEVGIDATAPIRMIAVDWSGDITASGQKDKIWVADWDAGELSLQSGISRDNTIEYLTKAARDQPSLVAGLDFAFSYPAWFVKEQGCDSAESFWSAVKREGEAWLGEPHDHFWGKLKGSRCPPAHRKTETPGLRLTEQEMIATRKKGLQPKSAFKIGGQGSVGTGSLRGIPYLLELKRAGFSVWPFDPARFPILVEIYPRVFTEDTVTSKCSARAAHLRDPRYDSISEYLRVKALDSEHAFDALCSVIGMKDHANQFANLQQATDETERIEGRIWRPVDLP